MLLHAFQNIFQRFDQEQIETSPWNNEKESEGRETAGIIFLFPVGGRTPLRFVFLYAFHKNLSWLPELVDEYNFPTHFEYPVQIFCPVNRIGFLPSYPDFCPKLHFFPQGLIPWNFLTCEAGVIISSFKSKDEIVSSKTYLTVKIHTSLARQFRSLSCSSWHWQLYAFCLQLSRNSGWRVHNL